MLLLFQMLDQGLLDGASVPVVELPGKRRSSSALRAEKRRRLLFEEDEEILQLLTVAVAAEFKRRFN